MLAARSTTCVSRGAPAVQRCVRVNAVKPVNTQGLLAAVTAGSLLLAGPSFAVLPDGFKSPQGSNTAVIEARLDELIEQRTGKSEALPELNTVPEMKEEAPKKREAPVVVAPMAPAVAEPPAPPAPLPTVEAVETPAAAARFEVPQAPVEPPKGLQIRSDTTSSAAAAAAPAAPSPAVLVGGGIAMLGAVVAAAMSNNGGAEGQAAAAPAAPAAAAAPPVPEGETAAAAVGGAGESTNPSSKAE